MLTPPADEDHSVAEPQARYELFFQQGTTVVGAPAVIGGRDLAPLAATTRRVLELQGYASPQQP